MGYTIAVRAKTPELRDVMLEFLTREFRPWSVLVPELGADDGVRGPTADLSYDDGGPTALGFDYSSWIGNWERRYIYTVLHWVALKVGEVREFPVEFLDQAKRYSCPYVVYDGCEMFPCIPFRDEAEARGRLHPRWHSWAVNTLGIYLCPDPRLYSSHLEGDYEGAIEGEMKRLEGLWKVE